MTLASLEFVAFLLIALIGYYCFPLKLRWMFLLSASAAFYAFAGPAAGAYLVGIALSVWACALLCKRFSWIPAAFGGLLAVGGLVFIKFYPVLRPEAEIIAPLGVSYFSLQALGYLLDVSRGKREAEKNPLKILLFVGYFPQMTQGPISDYGELAPRLLTGHPFSPENFAAGATLALFGLFKKLVLADRLAPFVQGVLKAPDSVPGWGVLLAVGGYTLELYCDFSGGIDMMRGVSAMFGVELALNFRRPFFAASVSEYWRRWNITLGAWLRKYVFYPMTVSRLSRWLTRVGRKVFGDKAGRNLPAAVATLVIFVLIGLWHGASWNALIYGGYFGLLMGAAMLMEPLFKKWKKKLGITTKTRWWQAFGMARTWILVFIAQFFALVFTPGESLTLFQRLFTAPWNTAEGIAFDALEFGIGAAAALVIFIWDLLAEKGWEAHRKLAGGFFLWRWLVLLFLIFAVLIFGIYGHGADAQAFLYMQF